MRNVSAAYRMPRIRCRSVCLLLLLAPPSAYANFIWPPVLYLLSFSLWWVVVGGLIIEAIVHKFVIRQALGRTVWFTIGTNVLSALVGTVVMLPFLIANPLLESIPGFALWPAVIVILVAIPAVNITIEYIAGTRLWGLPRTHGTLLSFVLANLFSFGLVVYGSLFHIDVSDRGHR